MKKGFGTIEPIYTKEKGHVIKDVEISAFVKGFVKKYKDSKLTNEEIFNYLEQLIK